MTDPLAQTLSEEGVDTPVESLAQQGLIDQAIASFKISRLSDQLNDGEVTFGGLDSSKFDANTLVAVDNVSQDGFWEAAMDGVSADGQDLGLQGRSAILDTGTTLIIAPQADADAVHAAIPGAQSDGQGGYTIPCTSNTSIALGFGGSQFAINPVDLLFTPVDPNDLTGDCVSGISAGEIDGATTWLVSLMSSRWARMCVGADDDVRVRVDRRRVPQERVHVRQPEHEPDLARSARLSSVRPIPSMQPRTHAARHDSYYTVPLAPDSSRTARCLH